MKKVLELKKKLTIVRAKIPEIAKNKYKVPTKESKKGKIIKIKIV